jgi:hypothetical protein
MVVFDRAVRPQALSNLYKRLREEGPVVEAGDTVRTKYPQLAGLF